MLVVLLFVLHVLILLSDGVVDAVRLSAVAKGDPIDVLLIIFGKTFLAEVDFLLGEKLEDLGFS